MKSVFRNLLFVLVIVSLISCASGTQIMTAVPSSTPVPSVTPTLTSVPTSTATERPKSAVDEIFALPTMGGGVIGATPVPIATPEFQNLSANLRVMSEKEYLELIRQMQESSYQNYPFGMDWHTESDFIESQIPVALAIQEYLYRFPDSPNAGRMRWQLAYINSLTSLGGNQYGDAWMLANLENMLDQGEVTPDKLEDILEQYSFSVYDLQPVGNLFQDGKTGWLYEIAPKILADWNLGGGGLFFVVREINENDFHIFLLNSAWNFTFGESSVFEISDHNQNGTPEIALYIGAHSGSMCNGNLLIYEWDENSFIELTEGEVKVSDCVEDFRYSTDRNNVPSIVLTKIFPNRKSLFIWNGETYIFDSYISSNSIDIWLNSVRDSNLSLDDEAELLKEIIVSGESQKQEQANIDFLRYRLGIVYALQSKHGEAVKQFQELVSSPVDQAKKVFPDMASKFMEVYTEDASVYNACRQSNFVFEKVVDANGGESAFYSSGKYEEVVGFPFDRFVLSRVFLCDESKAFELAINSIPSSIDNVPDELRKNGAIILYSEKLDVNLDDKREEWLVALDDGGLSIIFPNGLNYVASEVRPSVEINDSQSAHVTIQNWSSGQNPKMIINTENELGVYDVDKNYKTNNLLLEWDVEKNIISNQNISPEVQIFFKHPLPEAYYPYRPWSGYRWDAEYKNFRDDLFEYTLFVEHDFKKAAEIADVVAPLILEWADVDDFWNSRPNYLYLCGLSYELAGDKRSAAEIYWQLWHDFPESQYALMAKYKLEPVTP